MRLARSLLGAGLVQQAPRHSIHHDNMKRQSPLNSRPESPADTKGRLGIGLPDAATPIGPLLNLAQVVERVGLQKSTIFNLIHKGTPRFPSQVRINGASRWIAGEVEGYLAEVAAKRPNAPRYPIIPVPPTASARRGATDAPVDGSLIGAVVNLAEEVEELRETLKALCRHLGVREPGAR